MERLSQPGRGAWHADHSPPPCFVRASNKNGLTQLSATGHAPMGGPERTRGDQPFDVRARVLPHAG
ncbi:MAG: hypothetical protein HY260_09850 [Chloroflexi bacterium]|nr:hypothetical protein [Chloroflexota bacterium]